MGCTLLLVLVRMVDVINLCRNISDGVRPFMPPCSLVSLYAFTKISYLSLPSSMFGISSTARNSFFTILLYASIFPCNCLNETCFPAVDHGWSNVVPPAYFGHRRTCGQYFQHYIGLLFSSPSSTWHILYPPKCILRLA